jgi:hypothetical protein
MSLALRHSSEQNELRGDHYKVVYSLRQQGIFCSSVADFSPAGRKIGNNIMISTALPKAKTGLTM